MVIDRWSGADTNSLFRSLMEKVMSTHCPLWNPSSQTSPIILKKDKLIPGDEARIDASLHSLPSGFLFAFLDVIYSHSFFSLQQSLDIIKTFSVSRNAICKRSFGGGGGGWMLRAYPCSQNSLQYRNLLIRNCSDINTFGQSKKNFKGKQKPHKRVGMATGQGAGPLPVPVPAPIPAMGPISDP